MRVGALSLEVRYILDEAVDVTVESIILILIAHDLFLEDALLSFELVRILLQILYFTTSSIIILSKIPRTLRE